MDDSDIRRYITDTYKPLYLAAYQKDSVEGEAEMGDIEEALMSTDLGYDYDSHFNKWIRDYENKLNEGD